MWRWIAIVAIGAAGGLTEFASSKDAAAAEPPAAGPEETDNLALAARCLERGDEAGAVPYLMAIVRDHPDQLMFRAQLAELLFRLDRREEARHQFERFVAEAPEEKGVLRRHLVHCHTRLMELAALAEDQGEELFHRGVGLLRLVEADEDREDDGFRESVLGRAARALAEARDLKPRDAKVLFYLGEAYGRLGNPRAAVQAWAAARDVAVPGVLTRAEERKLRELACRDDRRRGR